MLDINFIRQNTTTVEEAMLSKGEKDIKIITELLQVDEQWRTLVHEIDTLRSESNALSKQIGVLMGQGKKSEAQALMAKTAGFKNEIKQKEEDIKLIKDARDSLLYRIPNIPHPDVPRGASEKDNVVQSTWGECEKENWKKPHWEITEANNWLDFERGVKVAGAGFPFYIGPMALMQRALIHFFLSKAIENNYTEMQAPLMVNEDSARGTGQIPDKEDMMYTVPGDGFFMIPTAEIPITNFHRDEIIPHSALPIRYVCHTPCWRREAGSYGKDVRGLNRLHQFDKVELVHIVHPNDSYAELESLREHAESLLQALELPYRTLLMCTGDMGFTQSKKYDLEVWSVGQQRWLEVSSCSNFESFQARRMQLRFKDSDGNIQMAHTLNGSGLALPRVMAALIEHYQTENGRVQVPKVLQPFTGRKYF